MSEFKSGSTAMIMWCLIFLLIGSFVDAADVGHYWMFRNTDLPNSPIYHINSFTGFRSTITPPFSRSTILSSPLRRLDAKFLSNGRARDAVTKFKSNPFSSISSKFLGVKKKGGTLSKFVKLSLKFVSNAKPYKLQINKPNGLNLG
ncbi:uncharacterized protein LOC111087042 [Limulus polyphemus]|uniref:Uncharacterized protein LOC111087042 n=1 Tax=Limulus polyphemus TaxID=6850 RepID=A0ABM1SWF7_LIMPO|nr:uncharacterized protein LOC111087042 [Limulus polyphemus]